MSTESNPPSETATPKVDAKATLRKLLDDSVNLEAPGRPEAAMFAVKFAIRCMEFLMQLDNGEVAITAEVFTVLSEDEMKACVSQLLVNSIEVQKAKHEAHKSK